MNTSCTAEMLAMELEIKTLMQAKLLRYFCCDLLAFFVVRKGIRKKMKEGRKEGKKPYGLAERTVN